MITVLWEDFLWEKYYPLTLTHAVFELRIGCLNLIERAKHYFPENTIFAVARSELREKLSSEGLKPLSSADVSEKALFINGRAVPRKEDFAKFTECEETTLFVSNDTVVAIFALPEDLAKIAEIMNSPPTENSYRQLVERFPKKECNVTITSAIWEIIHINSRQISLDFADIFSNMASLGMIHERAVVFGDVRVGGGSVVSPFAVLDGSEGPVIVGRNVEISPCAVILGPAYIGDGTRIMPHAKIREGTSIGPVCRVGGEVEESIIQGFSNKYHDGFLGHAFVGEWVNLGALTTNSDLKNNYHNIRVSTPFGVFETGFNKVGTFIGDHAKLGIGSLLPSGGTIGVCANFFGGGMAPKALPSFVWGSLDDGFVDYDLEKAIDTARIVMGRRERELTPQLEALLRSVFERTKKDREEFFDME